MPNRLFQVSRCRVARDQRPDRRRRHRRPRDQGDRTIPAAARMPPMPYASASDNAQPKTPSASEGDHGCGRSRSHSLRRRTASRAPGWRRTGPVVDLGDASLGRSDRDPEQQLDDHDRRRQRSRQNRDRDRRGRRRAWASRKELASTLITGSPRKRLEIRSPHASFSDLNHRYPAAGRSAEVTRSAAIAQNRSAR